MKKVKSFLAVVMALIMCMSFASVAFAADVTEADATNGVASGADAFAVGEMEDKFARADDTCLESTSTKVTCSAPRESASMPTAPLPEKRSRNIAPFISGESILKSDSLTLS